MNHRVWLRVVNLIAAVGLVACSRAERPAPAAPAPAHNAPSAAPALSAGSDEPAAQAQARGANAEVPRPTPHGNTARMGGNAVATPSAPPPGPAPARETQLAGSSNPLDDNRGAVTNAGGVECQNDRDCSCGIDRASGACAVGPTSRIDSEHQCPDYCSGIDGRQRTACEHGRCRLVR